MGLLDRIRPSRIAAAGRKEAGMAGLTDTAPVPPWSQRLQNVLAPSGFADWYCGELGARVARYQAVMQEQKPGTDEWSTIEDQNIAGPMREVWDSYRGGEEAETRESLIRRHAELYQIHGQVMICVNDDLTYEIFNRSMGEPKKAGGAIVEWRFSPVPGAQKNDQLVYAANRVFRRWIPDRDYPRLPWSPMKPAVDDLERYVDIVRMIRSGAVSAAVMRRILAVNGDWVGAELTAEEAAAAGTKYAGIRDIMEISRKAIKHEGIAAVAPFVLYTTNEEADVREGISKVEWPSPFEEVMLKAKTDALRDAVRSMNAPIRYVEEGPGDANHWADWLIEDQVDEVGAQPLADRVFSDITEVIMRPTLGALQALNRFPVSQDLSKLRVYYDTTSLQAEPKDTAMIFDALAAELISDDYARQRLHIPDTAKPDDAEMARNAERKRALNPFGRNTGELSVGNQAIPPEIPAALAGLAPFRGELPRWRD